MTKLDMRQLKNFFSKLFNQSVAVWALSAANDQFYEVVVGRHASVDHLHEIVTGVLPKERTDERASDVTNSIRFQLFMQTVRNG